MQKSSSTPAKAKQSNGIKSADFSISFTKNLKTFGSLQHGFRGTPSEFCSFSVWVEVRGAILIAFEKSGLPCPDRLTLPARAASQIRLNSMHALGSTHLHIEAQREISTTFTKAADCLFLFSNILQVPHACRKSQTKP